MVDDSDLVAAAAAGDRAAMDRLLRLHYDRVHAVCRRVTGHDADAADAAQEAMISIVRGIARFDGRSSFATWVYRIATNASLDELRRRRRRPLLAHGDPADGEPGGHPGNGDGHGVAAAADPDAGPRIDAVADRLALDQALRELPEDFRVPIVLRDVGDLDYAEIAEALDIPVGTVKSRIARGRAALAQLVRAGLDDGDPDRRGNRAAPDERPNHAP